MVVLVICTTLLLSACSQNQPESIIGQGSPLAENPEASGTEVKEFTMISKRFAFEPAVIEVNKSDKVRLVVTSMDVTHGIAIPEFGINERLPVGKPVTIEFIADKVGTFTTVCSVFCGSGHKDMKGTIIVT